MRHVDRIFDLVSKIDFFGQVFWYERKFYFFENFCVSQLKTKKFEINRIFANTI